MAISGFEELSSNVTLGQEDVDLSSSFTVRNIGAAPLSSSVQVRNASSVALSSNINMGNSADNSSSVTVRNASGDDLSSSVFVYQTGSADLSSSFDTSQNEDLPCSFKVIIFSSARRVERIDYQTTRVSEESPIVDLVDTYADVLLMDTEGYTKFTVQVVAGEPNDLTYRIQGKLMGPGGTPIWTAVPNQLDIDVASNDIENMGSAAIFTADFEQLRIQAKNKTGGMNSKAIALVKATRGGG